jgi:hypothetical protein
MKKEVTGNINDELFESFDPRDAEWVIGARKSTALASSTATPSGMDVDAVLDWSDEDVLKGS